MGRGVGAIRVVRWRKEKREVEGSRRDLELKGNVSQLLSLNVPQFPSRAACLPAWVLALGGGAFFHHSTDSAAQTAGFSPYRTLAFTVEISFLTPEILKFCNQDIPKSWNFETLKSGAGVQENLVRELGWGGEPGELGRSWCFRHWAATLPLTRPSRCPLPQSPLTFLLLGPGFKK